MAASGFFLSMLSGAVLGALGLLSSTRWPYSGLHGDHPPLRPGLSAIPHRRPLHDSALVLNNQLRFQATRPTPWWHRLRRRAEHRPGSAVHLRPPHGRLRRGGGHGHQPAFLLCLLLAGTCRPGCLRITLRNFHPTASTCADPQGRSPPCSGRASGAPPPLSSPRRPALGRRRHCGHGHREPGHPVHAFALIGFGQGFQPVCGFNYGAGLTAGKAGVFLLRQGHHGVHQCRHRFGLRLCPRRSSFSSGRSGRHRLRRLCPAAPGATMPLPRSSP